MEICNSQFMIYACPFHKSVQKRAVLPNILRCLELLCKKTNFIHCVTLSFGIKYLLGGGGGKEWISNKHICLSNSNSSFHFVD